MAQSDIVYCETCHKPLNREEAKELSLYGMKFEGKYSCGGCHILALTLLSIEVEPLIISLTK